MKYIAAKIHNSSLGKVVEVSSIEEGEKLIIKWAEEQLDRKLETEELDDIYGEREFYDDSDPNNHYTFSVAVVE